LIVSPKARRPQSIISGPSGSPPLATLRNLATDGPGDALLDHVRAEEREAGHHSEVQLEHLLGAAAAWLRFGMEPRSLAELSTDTVTGDHVRDVLHRALDTLLVSLGPIDTPSEPDELAAILGLPWAKGPDCHYAGMSNVARMKALMASDVEILSPRLFKGARGQQLILDPSRITWSVGSVGVIEVTWNEIVMAGECVDCGHWDLTDYAGDGFVVEPSKWRGGEKAVDAMRRNIPESLRYEIRHQVPAS